MKKKISIIFAAVAIIAVMAVNFQINNEITSLNELNFEILSQNAKATPEGEGGWPGRVWGYFMEWNGSCLVCTPRLDDDDCVVWEQCCIDQEPYCW